MKTVIALFESMQEAEQVVPALMAAGFPQENIGFLTQKNTKEAPHLPEAQATQAPYKVTTLEGAAPSTQEVKHDMSKGAIIGGMSGMLLGLTAMEFAIPGIGWVTAAGTLVTTLVGAGLGAVAGGTFSAMEKLGITKDQAAAYAEAMRQGHILVTVKVPDQRFDEASQIIQRHHPIDVEERFAEWQAKGEPQPEKTPDNTTSNSSRMF